MEEKGAKGGEGALTQASSKEGSGSRGGTSRSIDIYAAQCENCKKWRKIGSQEEYEEIRSEVTEKPFVCARKPGVSCNDPADIDYDATRVWVLDKPGIPKTPQGFTRSLVLRRDFSKMDAYYFAPTGKKLRTRNEIAAFLEKHPQYKDTSLEHFNFASPKVMENTIPEEVAKRNGSATGNRKVMENAIPEDAAKRGGSATGNRKVEENPIPEDVAKGTGNRKVMENPIPEDVAKRSGSATGNRKVTENAIPEDVRKVMENAVPEDVGKRTGNRKVVENPIPEDVAKRTGNRKVVENPKPEDVAKRTGSATGNRKVMENAIPEDVGKRTGSATGKRKKVKASKNAA